MNYAEEALSKLCPAGGYILKSLTAMMLAGVGSKNRAMKNRNICIWCKWEIGRAKTKSPFLSHFFFVCFPFNLQARCQDLTGAVYAMESWPCGAFSWGQAGR